MTTDFEAVAARLAEAVAAPRCGEVKVTEAALEACAAGMRPYRHSVESLRALEDCLKGYQLCLTGPVGTGKTMFFMRLPWKVERISLLRLFSKPLDEIDAMVAGLDGCEVVIDDVGAEPVYNNYGSKLDLLPWLIDRRLASRHRTHYTSNLTSKEMADRYGLRIVDRIGGTCRIHRFGGPGGRSMRQPSPARGVATCRMAIKAITGPGEEPCGGEAA